MSEAPDRARIERDFLLRSLDDLDAEYEAGDLPEQDYLRLRDSYTHRAAEVLRSRSDGELDEPAPSRSRAWLWVVGVVALATVSGVLLARSVGSRGVGGSLTGSGGSDRERSAACQRLSFQEPAKGIDCYDDLLADRPDDPEALTYRGWAKVRSGDTEGGSADFARVLDLDPRFPDVRVFRASVASKAGDYPAAQAELDALYALDPPEGVLSTLGSMGLDREIAYGLLPADVQACWDQAESAAGKLSTGEQEEATKLITAAITCLADVLAERPADLDALQAEGYLLGVANEELLYERARSVLDRAVQLDPRNPTSLLLRAALLNQHGDAAAAKVDLDALAQVPGRPSPLYAIAPVDQIREQVEAAVASTTTRPDGVTSTTR